MSALQSGNFNAVMTNFGLDPAAGADKLAFGDGTRLLDDKMKQHCCVSDSVCVNVAGVGAFLAAIQHWADHQDSSMPDAE